MIKLHKFGANFGIPDASPFVLKLETYLRLTDVGYEPVRSDVRKAPKGKLPCLDIDGEMIADSQFAIAALKAKFGDKLNEGLSAAELGQHHSLRLGLENHTYFLMLCDRWLDTKNAAVMRDTYFSKMGVMGKVIFKIVQRDIRRTVQGQGVLRHSEAERAQFAKEDIKALEAVLGEKDYFGGARPTEIDCVCFAFISNMLVAGFDHAFYHESRNSAALIGYNNRMAEIAFPDFKTTMTIS